MFYGASNIPEGDSLPFVEYIYIYMYSIYIYIYIHIYLFNYYYYFSAGSDSKRFLLHKRMSWLFVSGTAVSALW